MQYLQRNLNPEPVQLALHAVTIQIPSLNLPVQKCQVTAMFAELQQEIAQIEQILRVFNCKYYLICLRHLTFF